MSTRGVSVIPPGLYGICDDGVSPDRSLAEQARALLDGGVRVLQLRAKTTPLRALVEQTRALMPVCRAAGAVLLVNDRVDVALVAGAHGVHLGAEDLPVEEARRILGRDSVVGATTRNLGDIRRALAAGASYAGLGPVFQTRTKTVDAPALGLEKLESIVKDSPLPVVAISGITLENIQAVAATGVHGAAVISDLLRAADPAEQARRLSAAFAAGSCTVERT